MIMDNKELLEELSRRIRTGEISRAEVMNQFGPSPVTPQIIRVFYILGAVMVLVGIYFYIYQIWDDIGSFRRISLTLGVGLVMAFIGSILLKQKPETGIGSILHCIAGILIPGGALIAVDELIIDPAGFDFEFYHTLLIYSMTLGVIFVSYLCLMWVHKRAAVLTFFALANATVSAYFFLETIIYHYRYNYDQDDLRCYMIAAIGASYLLLAHAFRDAWNKGLVMVLRFLGITGCLSALFYLVVDSTSSSFDLLSLFYFLVLFAGFFLSVYMRSRIILFMSTLFFIAHMVHISFSYFDHSHGFSIILVILGFVCIGIGYAAISINKKYIKDE